MESGQRLHREALRGGWGRAQERLVLGEGSAWIWNVAADRGSGAHELLDFYHGSEHLWELGRALGKDDEGPTRGWVEPRLHELRHGREQKLLKELAALKLPGDPAGETVRQQPNYFAGHAGRMNDQETAARGWPIGSGAVESACRQSPCRCKRSGQFWTGPGLRAWCALDDARRNFHWDDLFWPVP
jgi:hypothetical protein